MARLSGLEHDYRTENVPHAVGDMYSGISSYGFAPGRDLPGATSIRRDEHEALVGTTDIVTAKKKTLIYIVSAAFKCGRVNLACASCSASRRGAADAHVS